MSSHITEKEIFKKKYQRSILLLILILVVFSCVILQHEWNECRIWWERNLDETASEINEALADESIDDFSSAVSMLEQYYYEIDAIDIENGTFIYAYNEQSIGKTVSEAGYTDEAFVPGEHIIKAADGTKKRVYTSLLKDEDNTAAIVIEFETEANYLSVIQLIIAFAVALFVLYIYIIGKKIEFRDNADRAEAKDNYGVIFSIILALSVLVFLIFFASYCMINIAEAINIDYVKSAISEQMDYELNERDAKLETLKQFTEGAIAGVSENKSISDRESLLKGDMVYWHKYGEDDQKVCVKDSYGQKLTAVPDNLLLKQICQEQNIANIRVFDDNGYCIASSDEEWNIKLSFDAESEDKELVDVLERITSSALVLKETENGMSVIAARPLIVKGDGVETNCLLTVTSYPDSEILTDDEIASEILKIVEKVFNVCITLIDSGDEHDVLYISDEFPEVTLAEMEIADEAFDVSRYMSVFNYKGVLYLQMLNSYTQTIMGTDECYLSSALPFADFISYAPGRYFGIVWVCIFAALLLSSIVIYKITPDMAAFDVLHAENYEAKGDVFKYFRKQSVYERLKNIASVTIDLSFILLIAYIFIRNLFMSEERNSFIIYMLNNKWHRGINVLAFLVAFMIIVMLLCLNAVGKQFYSLAALMLSKKGETVLNLVVSCVRYLLGIAALLTILWCFGMDVEGLLASLGIISVIFGLAAQDVIKDILAGSMIVFEGLIKLGDYVKIGETEGTVSEINLRNCHILTLGNEVVVINNADVKKFTNFSKDNLIFIMKFDVRLTFPLEELEEILDKELPKISERLSHMVQNITYMGVQQYTMYYKNYTYTIGLDVTLAQPPEMLVLAQGAVTEEIFKLGIKYGFCFGVMDVINKP